MEPRYAAKPVHLYTLCLPLLLIGALATAWGGAVIFWVGIVIIGLGTGMGGWIIFAGILQARSEHIEIVAYNSKVIAGNITTMSRVKDANVWAAIGYEMPTPEPQRVEHKPEAIHSLPRISFPTPPATTAQMKLLANSVLRGSKLSEPEWGGPGKVFSSPKWRALMHWGEHPDRLYWRFINPEQPTLGRVLTRRGTEFFMSYADEELHKLFDQGHIDVESPKIGNGREMLPG